MSNMNPQKIPNCMSLEAVEALYERGGDVVKAINEVAQAGHPMVVMACVPSDPEGDRFAVVISGDFVNADVDVLKSIADDKTVDVRQRTAAHIIGTMRAGMTAMASAVNHAYMNMDGEALKDIFQTIEDLNAYSEEARLADAGDNVVSITSNKSKLH